MALRSAAFDKRINKVVAYDVLYDGFHCMTNPFPIVIRWLIRFLFQIKSKNIINAMLEKAMKKS